MHTSISFQSKVQRNILDDPWFVSNRSIHTNLPIPIGADTIKTRFLKFQPIMYLQPYPQQYPLNPQRRLNRQWLIARKYQVISSSYELMPFVFSCTTHTLITLNAVDAIFKIKLLYPLLTLKHYDFKNLHTK